MQDCEKIYVGKKKKMETRTQEHFRNIRKWRSKEISGSRTSVDRKTHNGS